MPFIVGNTYVSSYAVELLIFFIISTVISLLTLQKLEGSFSNILPYFSSKSWPFMKSNPKFLLYTRIFAVMVVLILISPLASLILWGSVVLKLEEDYPTQILSIDFGNRSTILSEEDYYNSYSDSHLGGKSIFLVGFAGLCLFLTAGYIKWSNFHFKPSAIVVGFFSLSCFFAFQIIALFDDTNVSFTGMSAIFFGLNAQVMILFIFLLFSHETGSILDIIKNLDFGLSTPYKNFETIEELITEQLSDTNYTVTQLEIFRMVTAFRNVDELKTTVLGGGFITLFRSLRNLYQRIILTLLYLLSVGVLVAYALIIYYYRDNNRNKLGFLNLVMIVTTDLMLYFYHRVKAFADPLEVSIFLIANRVFLYAFGEELWFIGYCCLYIFLNLPICHYIVEHNWPLKDYSILTKKKVFDMSKTPEFIFFSSTALFLILIVVLAVCDFDGIPTKGFVLTNGKDFAFWNYGLASIFFVVVFLMFWMSRQIYKRYCLKIQDFVFYYVFSTNFDMYYVSLFGAYLCLIIIGGLCYAVIGEPFPLIICCFLPLVYETVMVVYFNLNLNDFRFPADTKMINDKMKNCREKIEAQSKKKSLATKTKTENEKNVQVNQDKEEKVMDDLENLLEEDDNQENKNNKKRFIIQDEEEKEVKEEAQEEGGPMDPELWAKNGITQFYDWRAMKIPFMKAFVQNYLIPTDYKIIYGGLLFILFDLAFCIASAFGSFGKDYQRIGPSIGVAIFSSVCFELPILHYLKNLTPVNSNDAILIIAGAGANYGYGFFYFFDVTKDFLTDPSTFYLLFFVFVFPGIFFFIPAYQLWRENPIRLANKYIFIFFFLGLLHFLALGIFLCAFRISLIAGGVVLGISGSVCLVILLFSKYISNNKSIPINWLRVLVGLLFAFTMSALISALVILEFNDFIGFSIFILSFTSIVFLLNLFLIYQDLSPGNQQPIFFSPWIFPVFIYDIKLGSIRMNNFPYLIYFSCLLIYFTWSVTLCVWVKPAMIGISLASFIEVILLLSFVYFSCYTPLAIGNFILTDALVPKARKKSWLKAKKAFLIRKGVVDPDDALTYKFYKGCLEKSRKELHEALKDYILKKNEKVVLRTNYKDYYNFGNMCQIEYLSEMRLLIRFLLELMVTSYNLVIEEQMRLINFVQNDRANLFSQLIFIILETEKTVNDKYTKIKRQYKNLDNEKKHIFDVMKKNYDEEKRKDKIESDKKNKAEEEAKKERMENLKHLSRTDQIDWSKPLCDIPDCFEKYQKIVEDFKKNGTIYDDTKFNEKSLGEKLQSIVTHWKRPSPEAKITKEGFNPLDIQQGTIGDCYFMSAISVIGDKYLNICFYLDKLENQDTGCGAYIVKFFVGEHIVEVIIDDKFPVDMNGNWVFGHSADKDELWPNILEKAYAKLYGGYYAIIGGKVSYALSELSQGIADEINLNTVKNNPENFWKKLVSFYYQGYLLGAGSPENPQGDSAFSEEGIVQGHAYSVLNVQDVGEVKLIKLRNPHGKHGREWTGEWSDNSYKWSIKTKAKIAELTKVSVEEIFAEDGAFWMSIDDFLFEFKYLYVCRIFSDEKWKILEPINGVWDGVTAVGLPSKENPKPKLQNNPQYNIVVTKKCTVFITLVQNEAIDTFKGKLPIFFMVQKEKGKKIFTKVDEKLVGISGAPTNLKSVGKEIDLFNSSYPSSFTLMVASAYSGDKGKGSFVIKVACTDKAVKITEIK